MKKSFDQPFNYSDHTTIYLLVEVKQDMFFQLHYRDELGLDYYDVLSLDSDNSNEQIPQLTKYLYEHGFSPNHYRELVRDTTVAFSFIDDTPGSVSDEVCLYVSADQIKEFKKARLVTLDKLLGNFKESPHSAHTVELGIIQLINERWIHDEF